MSLYDELNIDSAATQEEIKAAYRSRANQSHPDKEGGSDEEFKRVNEAYQVLKVPEDREYYDRTGSRDRETVKTKVDIIIEQMFRDIVINDSQGDMIDLLVKSLRVQHGEVQDELTDCWHVLDKLINKRGRITRKFDTKPNMYFLVVEREIDAKKKRIESIKEDLQVINEVAAEIIQYQDTGVFRDFR